MKKQSFWGLKKGAVESHLQNVKKHYEKEEFELHYKLHQLQSENESLESAIHKLKEKLAPTVEENVFVYAQERLPLTLSWLDSQEEEELKRLKSEHEKELAVLDEQIQKLDKEIENGTSLLYSMLNQYASVIENLNEDKMIEMDPSILLNSFSTSQVAASFEPLPVIEEEADSLKSAGNSFWEGAETYLSKSIGKTEKSSTFYKTEPKAAEQVHKHEQTEVETISEPEQQQHPQPPVTEKKPEHKQQPIESQGITQELDQIKNRYIIGKLAGADLFDDHGQLIVGKDVEITSEIVQRAKQAGVLAELIVHMKIPGLGDS